MLYIAIVQYIRSIAVVVYVVLLVLVAAGVGEQKLWRRRRRLEAA
jgi:hypothetical protein